MACVYLFNPENDTALGVDSPMYTPPLAARMLHDDGSLLPLWWADGTDDVVLTPFVSEGEALRRRYGLKGTPSVGVPSSPLPYRLCPWGWSRDAARQLRMAGVNDALLPTPERLAALRQLSHRRNAVKVMERLTEAMPGYRFPRLPREVWSVDEITGMEGAIYVKLPWSSSGRGVHRWDTANLTPGDMSRIRGMIANQGSVMVEAALDRICDFAALFSCDGEGNARYRGLSLFATDTRGGYEGNIVADECCLRHIISQYVDIDEYDAITRHLEKILGDIYGRAYRGWLGVDMMSYADGSDGNTRLIAPCVEVNMRMTMGVVAHLLRRNPLIAGMMPARFTVGRKSGDAEGIELSYREGAAFHFRVSPGGVSGNHGELRKDAAPAIP